MAYLFQKGFEHLIQLEGGIESLTGQVNGFDLTIAPSQLVLPALALGDIETEGSVHVGQVDLQQDQVGRRLTSGTEKCVRAAQPEGKFVMVSQQIPKHLNVGALAIDNEYRLLPGFFRHMPHI